jgi:hypothetical protein
MPHQTESMNTQSQCLMHWLNALNKQYYLTCSKLEVLMSVQDALRPLTPSWETTQEIALLQRKSETYLTEMIVGSLKTELGSAC